MKLLITRVFKNKVYKRFKRYTVKYNARYDRVEKAINEMRKWSDIPLSMQLDSIYAILEIQDTIGARLFVTGLNFPNIDINKESKHLPLV